MGLERWAAPVARLDAGIDDLFDKLRGDIRLALQVSMEEAVKFDRRIPGTENDLGNLGVRAAVAHEFLERPPLQIEIWDAGHRVETPENAQVWSRGNSLR
jgi:hypothetical protein